MSVTLCSNGNYWQAQWFDSNGIRQRRSLGSKKAMNKREARAACVEMAATMLLEPAHRDHRGSPTVEAWWGLYEPMRTDLKDGTLTIHKAAWERFTKTVRPTLTMDKITARHGFAFAAKLAGSGLTTSGQSCYMRSVKAMLEYARKGRFIPTNPWVDVPAGQSEAQHDWKQVSRDDFAKMLDQCPNAGWRALLALCRYAGLRRGEALRLTVNDINWTASTLNVYPEGAEGTKQRFRVVPIDPALMPILLEAREASDDGRVCPVSHNNLDANATAIAERAGVGRYAKPFHTLRKNLESEWLADHPIMDVCKWLGHSPSVAMRHYHATTAASMARVTGQKATTLTQNRVPNKQDIL